MLPVADPGTAAGSHFAAVRTGGTGVAAMGERSEETESDASRPSITRPSVPEDFESAPFRMSFTRSICLALVVCEMGGNNQ